MSKLVRIALVGDFNPEFHSHHATNSALEHAATHMGTTVEYVWIPTSGLDPERDLLSFDGIWATPGSPYRSMDGMLSAIEFARTRGWPFAAT